MMGNHGQNQRQVHALFQERMPETTHGIKRRLRPDHAVPRENHACASGLFKMLSSSCAGVNVSVNCHSSIALRGIRFPATRRLIVVSAAPQDSIWAKLVSDNLR